MFHIVRVITEVILDQVVSEDKRRVFSSHQRKWVDDYWNNNKEDLKPNKARLGCGCCYTETIHYIEDTTATIKY